MYTGKYAKWPVMRSSKRRTPHLTSDALLIHTQYSILSRLLCNLCALFVLKFDA